MPNQVSEKIKLARAKEFRKLGSGLRRKFIKSQLGKEFDVLFEEKHGARTFAGWTSNYIKVVMRGKNLTNKICRVRLNQKNVKVQDFS